MSPPSAPSRGSAPPPALPFGPTNFFEMFVGVQVPDPVTFTVGEQWLNRPNLYPRQATVLKIVFLRDDLFTEYDNQVIDEWEETFRRTGNEGICPGIRQRITWLKSREAKWFREVLFVMGRRAGKGYLSALSMSYVLWIFLSKGNPQHYFGVDRDKRLSFLIFAGKRDQAKATVFGDLVGVISSSECFAPYISTSQTERLSIYAPNDFVRMRKLAQRGIRTQRDMASFEILPKESTPMAGRGPTTVSLAFDEMAHITASGTSKSADLVYSSSKPSTDQFGDDAFIVEPSSPWQMMGQFYENYKEAIALDENGFPARPNYLALQLPSWAIYQDWERAHEIPMFPEGYRGDLGEYADLVEQGIRPCFQPMRKAVQVFDDEMEREKASNPETFAVEREAHWATALDAYLNEEKVNQIFEPWLERPGRYGPPVITQQSQGIFAHTYRGHADPSKVNDKFGYAIGHEEIDEQGRSHCVIDMVGHFDPKDFPDNIIDYEEVGDFLWERIIKPFTPAEFTFDQYNAVATVQKLQKLVRGANLPRNVNVFEQPTTRAGDWQEKENAKAAINLGLVHCPPNERLRDELRFLQLVNGRVDHPSAGPVQSKDIADSVMRVVHSIIGEQTRNFLHKDMSGLSVGLGTTGQPFPGMTQGGMDGTEQDRINALSGFTRARGGLGDRVRQGGGQRRGRW